MLLVAFGIALVLAALAGVRSAPSEDLFDVRRSTQLTGPDGAKGFADALEALGVRVERRRRALFGIAADTVAVDPNAWFALLSLIPQPLDFSRAARGAGGGGALPSPVEARELMRYVARGGALLLVGGTGIERCLGVRVVRLPRGERDVVEVSSPSGAEELPAARYVLRRIGGAVQERGAADSDEFGTPRCEAPEIVSTRLLLRAANGRAVAWKMRLEGGGRVILVADSRYFSNQFLRETDAGLAVLRWLLDEGPTRVIVDEYHQGFGKGGSIFGAAWYWARTRPGGWAILQLAFAGLLALAVSAVRFGPALRVVERRRRSPLEHLDALAVGLERAEGRDTAVQLITMGLRRRLSRTGHLRRASGRDLKQWLESLALAARSNDARAAVKRLGWLLRERGGDEHVLNAARSVEDVWEALRPAHRYKRS